MPYALSLQTYCKPEFFAEPPESWVTRLREISPVRSDVDHLVFRWFAPHESWNFSDHGMWSLYSAKPLHLVEKDRAEQFRLHWSELDSTQQEGRKAVVSDYQHFMWHSRGLYVRPFWLLQGAWGGTPAKYSDRERRYLDASAMLSEPFPLGCFPPCPFDERAVKLILERDRLLKACNRLDDLEKMDRPDAMKAEQDAAEMLFRETYVDTIREMHRPSVEFMRSYLRKSEADMALPKATKEQANVISQWRDVFKETGQLMRAPIAAPRLVA